jgi:hypothetical protein
MDVKKAQYQEADASAQELIDYADIVRKADIISSKGEYSDYSNNPIYLDFVEKSRIIREKYGYSATSAMGALGMASIFSEKAAGLKTDLSIATAESTGSLLDIQMRKAEMNKPVAGVSDEDVYNYAVSLAGKKLSAEEAAVFGLNEGDTIGMPLLSNLYSAAKTSITSNAKLSTFEKAKAVTGLKQITPDTIDIDTAQEKLSYLSQFADDPSKITDADYAVLGFAPGTAYGTMIGNLRTGAVSEVYAQAAKDQNYTSLEQQSDVTNINQMGNARQAGQSSSGRGDTIINMNIAGNLVNYDELVRQLDSTRATMVKQGRSI